MAAFGDGVVGWATPKGVAASIRVSNRVCRC
jgi:hypothetical protein